VLTVNTADAIDVLVMLTQEVTTHDAVVGHPLPTLKLTVPVKPFCGVMVMVEVPMPPEAEIFIEEGLADREKSETEMFEGVELEVA
jgi:hypothetical protein